MRTLMRMLICLLPLPLVSGCIPVVAGAATETAVVAAQERTPGHAVDDAGILLQIKSLYTQKNFSDLFLSVEIKVVESRVLLTGNVNSSDDAIEAVRLAWTVNGVKEVMNEIQINDKTSFKDYALDVWISTQVRTRLLVAKNIHSVNYSVITVNGTVYLMGIAQDQAELERASYVASTTSYVQRVVSHVRVKDDPRRP
jgi:osmotically-inducible protein OsmY